MTLNVFLPDGVETRYNVKATMRDGVNLSADIYYPRNRHEALPVILSRTPYDNMNERMVNSAIFYAQQGYVFVAQATRDGMIRRASSILGSMNSMTATILLNGSDIKNGATATWAWLEDHTLATCSGKRRLWAAVI